MLPHLAIFISYTVANIFIVTKRLVNFFSFVKLKKLNCKVLTRREINDKVKCFVVGNYLKNFVLTDLTENVVTNEILSVSLGSIEILEDEGKPNCHYFTHFLSHNPGNMPPIVLFSWNYAWRGWALFYLTSEDPIWQLFPIWHFGIQKHFGIHTGK